VTGTISITVLENSDRSTAERDNSDNQRQFSHEIRCKSTSTGTHNGKVATNEAGKDLREWSDSLSKINTLRFAQVDVFLAAKTIYR
jgi:hypothetical protein